MQRKLVKYFILLAFGLLILTNVHAEDIICNYPSGIDLQYKSGEIIPHYDKLKNEWFQYQSLIYDAGQSMYAEDEILIIDQEQMKKDLDNYVCPSPIYMCELSKWGIELPSLLSLTGSIDEIMGILVDGLTFDQFDLTELSKGDPKWTLFHLNKKELHIMSELEYEENYEDNEGTYLTDIISKHATTAAEWCTLGDGVDIAEEAVDISCGLVGGLAETIADIVWSDDEILIGVQSIECQGYNYPEDGPYIPLNSSCMLLSAKDKKLDQLIDKYNNCEETDKSCKLENESELKIVKEEMKTLCSSVLSEYSYENSQKKCIDVCLKLEKKYSEIIPKVEGECGFSRRLISFISNILKWAKYILPVIVIVLGILDFMKAMGADKEDEMKKAQQRFIKRLIAAALLFIVPLILEFVLDKMGFGYDDCGLF